MRIEGIHIKMALPSMYAAAVACALALHAHPVHAQKEGWSCKNGFWTEDGKGPSEWACGTNTEATNTDKTEWKDKDGLTKVDYNTCSSTGFSSTQGQALDTTYHRTCISGPVRGGSGPRCWWTHVPDAVAKSTDANLKVPVVIKMHGGGGCFFTSVGEEILEPTAEKEPGGLQALSETLSAKDTFITVWPQGEEKLWASEGSDSKVASEGEKKKQTADWDDVAFIESMIATIVKSTTDSKWKGRVDASRVYLTGFSLGCMMAHRVIMEKSSIIAAMSCHGGGLTGLQEDTPAALDKEQAKYAIAPTPIYITIGTEDVWMPIARTGWKAWNHWNGCNTTVNATRTSLVLSALGTKSTDAVEYRASTCGALTGMVTITGDGHTGDSRMTSRFWDVLKGSTRAGALAKLPAASAELVIKAQNVQNAKTTNAPATTNAAASVPVAQSLMSLMTAAMATLVFVA